MNVLVTGANGFIGKALCNKLIADGYLVRGAVRGAVQMTILSSGVEGAMIGDIGPETDWSEALDGIDTVVHLAARVHVMDDSAADPLAEFRKVNTAGTLNLARQVVAVGVRRLALSMNIPARLIPVPVCLLRLGGSLLGKKSEVDRLCGSLHVDISKAKSVLGWKPPLSVDEGLAKVADWYKK